MQKRKSYEITQQMGHLLFRVSAAFGLPEKLGSKTYDVPERGMATEDARKLYRELRSLTPEYDRQDLFLRFGPLSNWVEDESKRGTWSLIDPDLSVTLRIDEDAHMGAFWCLLLSLHPASAAVIDARSQEEVVWECAEKLRLVKMIRKEMGIDDAKKRRIELDDDPSGEGNGKSEEKKEEPKKEVAASTKSTPAKVETT